MGEGDHEDLSILLLVVRHDKGGPAMRSPIALWVHPPVTECVRQVSARAG